MLMLYQAEWCPYSSRVRERLTELGADFVAKQVEPEPPEREAMRGATGRDEIPTLVDENGSVVTGTDSILAYLLDRFEEPETAPAHRRKAAEHRLPQP